MKTRLVTLVLLIAAFTFAGKPSMSATMKVSDVERVCRTNNDTCQMFIWGLAQGLSFRDILSDQRTADGQFQERKPVLFCLPDNLTAYSLMLAFKIKLAEDLAVFPQDRDQEAPGFSAGVLLHLFPCKPTQKQ